METDYAKKLFIMLQLNLIFQNLNSIKHCVDKGAPLPETAVNYYRILVKITVNSEIFTRLLLRELSISELFARS